MKSSIVVFKRNASLFKIINLFNNLHLTVYTVLTLFESSAGQYFNEPFTNFPANQIPGSFAYPPIANFPVTQPPYYGSQFTLANHFSPMTQPSSPFVQPPANPWNPQQQLANNGESNDAKGNLPFSNSDSSSDRGKFNVEGEETSVPSKLTDNHEKQAEKNTEKLWQTDSNFNTDRRFGLFSKLWNKKKSKKASTKHKHDHFYHQNVHHHHHHHHYHHHIHHYPGGKPNPFKKAMKKLKYKWKFKSKIKEIGEAPPTQQIFGQPTPVMPYPDPSQPYKQVTVHHHHPPGPNGYWQK